MAATRIPERPSTGEYLLVATLVAVLVTVFVPAAPSEDDDPVPTSVVECDDLCRAVDLLEELRGRYPEMTPTERSVVDSVAAAVEPAIPPGSTVPPPPPTTTTSTTSTTTTTTAPRPPTTTPPRGVLDDLLDLLELTPAAPPVTEDDDDL